MKTLHVFSDGGHAWVKVKLSDLIKLKIEQYITSFSYQKGDYVYLEEDCDAASYIEALKAKNIAFKFKEHHSNRRSKIRGYARYNYTYIRPTQLVTIEYL